MKVKGLLYIRFPSTDALGRLKVLTGAPGIAGQRDPKTAPWPIFLYTSYQLSRGPDSCELANYRRI